MTRAPRLIASLTAGPRNEWAAPLRLHNLLAKCLEIQQQVPHHLVPLLGILAERLSHDSLELGGDRLIVGSERRRIAVRIATSTWLRVAPPNGRRPATISYRTTPNAQMSARA